MLLQRYGEAALIPVSTSPISLVQTVPVAGDLSVPSLLRNDRTLSRISAGALVRIAARTLSPALCYGTFDFGMTKASKAGPLP